MAFGPGVMVSRRSLSRDGMLNNEAMRRTKRSDEVTIGVSSGSPGNGSIHGGSGWRCRKPVQMKIIGELRPRGEKNHKRAQYWRKKKGQNGPRCTNHR